MSEFKRGDMVEIIQDSGLRTIGLGLGARAEVTLVDNDDTLKVRDPRPSQHSTTWWLTFRQVKRLNQNKLFPVRPRARFDAPKSQGLS